MGTVLAHLRKEWHEQRITLAAVGAAVLALAVLGGWALRLSASDYGTFAAPFVGGAVALTVLALSTELFAAEGRRDGFGFLRRVPGALRTSWAVKTALYLGAVAATTAWGTAAWLLAATLWKGTSATTEAVAALSKPDVAILVAGGTVVGLWILLASIWIPRGAGAAGAALLLLGALGVPAWLLLREHPVFLYGVPFSWVVAAAVALVVLPILAAPFGLLRGLRVARHPWAAAWRGLAVVGLVAGPAYAAGFVRFERWCDLQPDEEGVALDAVVGDGGRYAWVTAYRSPEEKWNVNIGRTFRIDLESGEAMPLGPIGSFLHAPGMVLLERGRTRSLVSVYTPSIDGHSVAWYDATDGRWLKTLALDLTTPDLLAPRRAELRRQTSVRLPDGRPVWIFGRNVEHDEEGGKVRSVPLPKDLVVHQGHSCGAWSGYDLNASRMVAIVPTADGGVRTLPWEAPGRPGASTRLTPGRYLCALTVRKGAPPPEGGRWRLVDTEAGTDVVAKGLVSTDGVPAVVDAARVLVERDDAAAGGRILVVVDPATGETTPLPVPLGAPSAFTEIDVAGRRSDGGLVLHAVGAKDHGRGYLLLDRAALRATSWTPAASERPGELQFVDCPDLETLVLLEEGRRLVRLRWGSGERTVLYPR